MPSARTSKPASTADDMIKVEEPVVVVEPEAASSPEPEAAPQAVAPAESAASAVGRNAPGGHAYRHREIAFRGGKLILGRDGSIRNVAADGTLIGAWQTDDPEWWRQAIRFGIRPNTGGGNAVPGHPPQRAKRPNS